MNATDLITLRADSTPVFTLATMSLRYEVVRSLSGEQLLALNRAAILDQQPGEDFNASFDRNVDLIVKARASEKGAEG